MSGSDLLADEARRVSTLRMQMLEMHPFWGYLLLQVKLVPATHLEAFAATDCIRHIWYNPELTSHLSTSQLGFVLAHEVCHQVLASMDRRRGRVHHLWNCATDYAINRIVADIEHPGRPGQRLYDDPSGVIPGLGKVIILMDKRWDGMIAEAIYEYLVNETLPDPTTVTLQLDELTIPNVQDHGGGVDVHLPGDLSREQKEELTDRIASAVEAWRQSDMAGSMPGEMVREIELRRRPQIPWQRIFRQYAGQATARDEYALSRPNKRYLNEGLVVPGLFSEKAGCIVVSLDTSGSMTATELEVVGVELRALHDQAEEMTLIVADADVQEVIGDNRLASFLKAGRFRGGGGTSHVPVFDWMRERHLRPDLFIGLTDLYSDFPDRRPPFPVVWLVPEAHGTAPWGKVIEVKT